MIKAILKQYVYHFTSQQWLLVMLAVFLIGCLMLRGAGSRKHG